MYKGFETYSKTFEYVIRLPSSNWFNANEPATFALCYVSSKISNTYNVYYFSKKCNNWSYNCLKYLELFQTNKEEKEIYKCTQGGRVDYYNRHCICKI
jgi:hypothetical protein